MRRFGLVAALLTCWQGSFLPLAAQNRDFVYITGVRGVIPDSSTRFSIEDQTIVTLDRVGAELRAHGLDYGDVVVSNVFLSDTRHFRGMNEVYRRYFPNDPPTRATVAVDLADPDALVQISVIATRLPKEVITPRGMMSPELPYSWGIKAGNTLFIAGATSRSPETYRPVAGDIGAQTRRIFGNIGLVLDAAGMGYGDLVSCTVFLDDPRRFGAMNAVYGEFVPGEDPPARAAVRAGLMNSVFDAEIQCIAERSSSRRVVVAEGRRRPRSPLSPAILVGNRLYLAGMVGRGSDGVPPDIAGQTRNALENLRATLGAAGMDFTNMVVVSVYLADIRHSGDVLEVLDQVFPLSAPAAAVVGASLMGSSLLVEIQMVAER